MAGHNREGRDTEDTWKLLCSDANQRDGVLGLDCLTPRPDHCDLLLDAIDKQLDQLQIKSSRPKRGAVLTAQTARNTEKTLSSWDVSVNRMETKRSLDVILRDKEEPESRMDQVIWRLERLLGEACKEGKIAGEAQPPSDSICTEDFVRRYKEEMADLSPFEKMDQLNMKEKTERTEISDGGSHQSDQNRQSPESRGSETSDTVMTHGFHSNQSGPGKDERTCLFGSRGENMSQDNEKAGVGERNRTLQMPGDCSSALRFDSVSADSDPNTDGTERVRQQARWTGRCSFTEDVGDLTDSCADHSDNDTAAEEETEVQSAAVRRFSDGRARSLSVPSNCQLKGRKTNRLSLSDNKDGHKGLNGCIRTSTAVRTSERRPSDCIKMREEVSDLRHKCEKEQTKLRLKWIQLKDVELCLSELRQKKRQALQQLERLSADTAQMQKEKKSLESALRHSRYQLQQLQRQRGSCLKYEFCWDRSCGKMSALELEELDRQLDWAKAELFAERRRSREKIESLQELFLRTLVNEELHEDQHSKQKDSDIAANLPSRDRQGFICSTVRKKKQLEEVHEELHRATEAGSSLLNRCACRHKQMETGHLAEEALGVEVSEPQHEVGGWRVSVETLGDTLAQRELQLTGLQEERESLLAERDNLKRELQYLKSQRCREQAEAQEEAAAVTQQELSIQRRQLEEEKDQALTSLQTRLIQEHSEELRRLGCVNRTDGGAAASLCRQLKAKDLELRQLQVSKGQRKQQTAARLATQLTAEPERFAVPQDKADEMQAS